MRYIPLEDLANERLIKAFERLERNYLRKMQGMNTQARKDFIRGRTIWNKLQRLMYNLSERKCWYSEAPPGAGAFVIEHFRPKNRSVQFDGTVLRPDGYWWLAFNWRNYRLSGELINIRRKDPFGLGGEVKGKGNYFPLDILGGSSVASFGSNLRLELPILLDPTKRYDTSLISFDKNGEPIIPSDIEQIDKFRAQTSIVLYHLDLEQLSYYRSLVWNKTEVELADINNTLKDAANEFEKRAILERACLTLTELTNKRAPFSKVAWACIDANIERYKSWLKNLRNAFCN